MKRQLIVWSFGVLVAAVAAGLGTEVNVYENPNGFATVPALEIGDPAPPLKIDRWLRGTPLTSFGDGNVYVVEFWASWCGPCRKSVPDMTAIERRFRARGFRVIAVNAAETDDGQALESFLAARGSDVDYAVGFTKDEMTFRRWMWAARNTGLPWAFIIDRQGRVAWWGQPLEDGFEAAIQSVLDGRLSITQAADAKSMQLERRRPLWDLQQKFWELVGQEKWEAALAIAERLAASRDELFYYEEATRFSLLFQRLDRRGEALALATSTALKGWLAGKAEAQFAMAGAILDSSGLIPREIELAVALLEGARERTRSQSPEVLARLATAYERQGRPKDAIAALRLASPRSDSPLREDLDRRLAEMTAGGAWARSERR